MRRSRWSLEDAKNSFSAVVEAAQRGRPQTVTKRGKPAVVIVAVEEFEKLRAGEQATAARFTDYLLAMPSGEAEATGATIRLRDVEL